MVLAEPRTLQVVAAPAGQTITINSRTTRREAIKVTMVIEVTEATVETAVVITIIEKVAVDITVDIQGPTILRNTAVSQGRIIIIKTTEKTSCKHY